MEDLEKTYYSESSEDSLKKKNFFIRFLEKIWFFLKGKIIFLYDRLEEISFLRAVFVGLALGIFAFGLMLFLATLWLIR